MCIFCGTVVVLMVNFSSSALIVVYLVDIISIIDYNIINIGQQFPALFL